MYRIDSIYDDCGNYYYSAIVWGKPYIFPLDYGVVTLVATKSSESREVTFNVLKDLCINGEIFGSKVFSDGTVACCLWSEEAYRFLDLVKSCRLVQDVGELSQNMSFVSWDWNHRNTMYNGEFLNEFVGMDLVHAHLADAKWDYASSKKGIVTLSQIEYRDDTYLYGRANLIDRQLKHKTAFLDSSNHLIFNFSSVNLPHVESKKLYLVFDMSSRLLLDLA